MEVCLQIVQSQPIIMSIQTGAYNKRKLTLLLILTAGLNKPKIKLKKRPMVEETATTTTNKHFLKRKRRQEMSANSGSKAEYT